MKRILVFFCVTLTINGFAQRYTGYGDARIDERVLENLNRAVARYAGSVATSLTVVSDGDSLFKQYKRACFLKTLNAPIRLVGRMSVVDLQTLYQNHLRERYCLDADGNLEPIKMRDKHGHFYSVIYLYRFRVSQMIGNGVYLCYVKSVSGEVICPRHLVYQCSYCQRNITVRLDTPYAINVGQKEIADDTYITSRLREEEGLFSYITVLGARKNIKTFSVVPTTLPSLEQIVKFYEEGMTFSVDLPCIFPCLCSGGVIVEPCTACSGTGFESNRNFRSTAKRPCRTCVGRKTTRTTCTYCKGKNQLVLPGVCEIMAKDKVDEVIRL